MITEYHYEDPMAVMQTTIEVAEELGIAATSVRRWAQRLGIGRKFGGRDWFFLPHEIEALRTRPQQVGRPKGVARD